MRPYSREQGQVLVEIIIAISLMAIVSALVIHSGFLSVRQTNVGGGQTSMISIAQEGIEAFEAIARSDWHGVYNLTGKGTTEYYPLVSSSTAWVATTTVGYKTVTVDSVNYSRWAIIDNVSRTSGYIDNSANDDPSTQKITLHVTAAGQPNVEIVRYVARARNTTASQTDWSGGTNETNPNTGFDANFDNRYSGDNGDADVGNTLCTGGGQCIRIKTQP